MLLLGRGATAPNILYYYCLVAVQLLRIYYYLLLLGRAPIIACYCLVAVQLLRIYCTIIAWSRFDYSSKMQVRYELVISYELNANDYL
jgi:hypothetical protein